VPFRTVAGTESVVAQLQVVWDSGVVESLFVGVAHNIGDVVYAFAVHVVDSVATSTAYTYYLDDAVVGLWKVNDGKSHIKINILLISHILYVIYGCYC
jgi:hypothetical protein